MAVINSKNINNDDVTEVTDFIGINKRFKGLDSSLSGKGNQADIDSLTASMASTTQNIFSPLKYQCKGDGVTDDTTNFLATIAALKANGGGTLLIPAYCTFLVSQSLVFDTISNFSVIGYTSSKIKRKLGFTGDLIDFTNCNNFDVIGTFIDSDDGLVPATLTSNVDGTQLTLPVTSTAGYPSSGTIYISSSFQGATVTSITPTSFICSSRWSPNVSANSGTVIMPSYGRVVEIRNCTNFRFLYNTINGNYNHALSDLLSLDATYTTTTNGDGTLAGTVTIPTTNGLIAFNKLTNSGKEGVNHRFGCSYINVENNYIYNCYGTGVTQKGQDSIVKGNMIVNCYVGTEVNSEGNIVGEGWRNTVEGNHIYNCFMGVFASATATVMTGSSSANWTTAYKVNNNRIYNSTLAGIWAKYATEVDFSDNRVTNTQAVTGTATRGGSNEGLGIGIYGAYLRNSTITNNICKDNANEGTYVMQSSFVKVETNRLSSPVNTTRLIYFGNNSNGSSLKNNSSNNGSFQVFSCTDTDISGNDISASSTFGILVSGDSQYCKVDNNQIFNTGQDGIKFDGTARTQKSNQALNNKFHLVAQQGAGFFPVSVVNNQNGVFSYNVATIDSTQSLKPTAGVSLDSATTGSYAYDNIGIGIALGTKDNNTTTPNTIR